VVPLDLWGGGSVAQYHHAQKGERGPVLALIGRKECRSLGSRAGRQQLLLCSRLIQHSMEEMHPRVGMRLGHPKELSLHFLNEVLFHIGQDEEELVDHRG
jgi:hypothetical protein